MNAEPLWRLNDQKDNPNRQRLAILRFLEEKGLEGGSGARGLSPWRCGGEERELYINSPKEQIDEYRGH